MFGVAYYAQWKLTADELGSYTLPGGSTVSADLPNKHDVFGIGPDVALPVASKSTLFALVNIRYLWETGAFEDDGKHLGPDGDIVRFPA